MTELFVESVKAYLLDRWQVEDHSFYLATCFCMTCYQTAVFLNFRSRIARDEE